MKQTLKQLIKKCDFSYINEDIIEKNFPKPKVIQKDNWKLIRFAKGFTSQEALDEIKKQGCRPANCWELIEWASKNRKELKKNEWCLAFGQLWEDSGGDRRVPGVDRFSGGGFGLYLGHFGYGWVDGYCILGFSDSNLDSLTLKR